jgi:hypothetical protein
MPGEHNESRSVASRVSNDSGGAIAVLADRPLLPNAGIPLNLDWVREVRVNTSAVERRVQSHVTRRTVKKEWQAAWLLRAITCMDLTTLSGDDTDERVRRLCAKGRHPIQPELEKKLGIEELQTKVAAICVYHTFVETALHALEGSGIHVAAVSTGFPAYRRWRSGSRRFVDQWRLVRTRSTLSSLAPMFSAGAGRRFTMKWLLSSRPVDRPT